MKPTSLITSTALALLMGACAALADDTFANSPVKSVTLSSGGMAEIKREAVVSGDGEIRIEVPLDQVDDVLKSLVVYDTNGAVKDISLAGRNPLEDTFKGMPFGPDDLGSLPRLLTALKGSEVTVKGSNEGTGVILGVETAQSKDAAERNTLNLLSKGGLIRRFEIDGSTTVEFTDPRIRQKLATAMGVVGSNLTDKSRNIVVKVSGVGQRDVDFSYVVPTPIWKTSYRVVVSKDGEARLQAWAILENASGEDWSGVKLTLSSSSPVTLSQRLLDRYWKRRSELPVMVDDVGLPPQDGGAVTFDLAKRMDRGAKAAVAPSFAPQMAMEGMVASPAPVQEMAYAQSATSSEGDISASFALDGTYDIRNGDTVSVPIVDKKVDAELVSLFQPDKGDTHPIAAVSLKNTTGTSLPGGILTVYDDGGDYVGDSSLLGLPAGETRMSSFALDRKVTIATDVDNGVQITEIKVADGILHARSLQRDTRSYTVKGAPDGERTVVIEQAKNQGWTMKSEALDSESATHYRLKVKLEAGETKTVKAVSEMVYDETYGLADLSPELIVNYIGNSTDPAVKDKLKELAAAKSDEQRLRTDLERIETQSERTAKEQARTRSNLGTLAKGSDEYNGFMAKLVAQEAAIDGLETQRAEVVKKLEAYTDKVGQIIRTF
jgi:hypothetical protein